MPDLKRIVVVHDSIDARGGATGLARLSALQYEALGYDVVFLTAAADDQSFDDTGIRVVGLGQQRLLAQGKLQAFMSGLHNQAAAAAISDWIKANDTPDTAYHLHNWAQVLSPSVYQALQPVAARTVVSCHDFFNACPNGGLLHYKKSQPCSLKPMSAACWMSQCDRRNSAQKYWRMIRHLNLNRLAGFRSSQMTFVCLHDGMADLMREIGFTPPHLTAIANPATAYTDQRVTCEANEAFLYVGRLTNEKGADIALEGAKSAGVPIIMVGEGTLEPDLRQRYDRATFPGFCDKAAIAEHARKARGVIVPSRVREPYGLVIAEAALSGLPVLVSEQSLLSSALEDLQMGAAFNPLEPAGLTALIRQWADDDGLIKSMSENAITHADSICSSPEAWANQFVAIMGDKLQAQ